MSASDTQGQAWLTEARDQIRAAAQSRRPIQIQGHGSKAFLGQLPSPKAQMPSTLSTLGHTGIVSYDPTELVVVVRSGTPLVELEAALAERRQMLAFEPPRFQSSLGQGTVGGMVATGLSGPRRLAAGACRDFLLGLTLLNGQGELLRFGGTVMKNVAGYDHSRLQAGAMGSLGLLLDLSLKVLPVPAAESSVRLPLTESQAIDFSNRWLAEPLPLVSTAWLAQTPGQGELTLRFSGAEAAVRSAVHRFTQLSAAPGLPRAEALSNAEADAFWLALRDQTHGLFADRPGRSLWRISLPSTSPAFVLDDTELLAHEWGSGLRWAWSARSPEAFRASLAKACPAAQATLYRCAVEDWRRQEPVFHPLAPAVAQLNDRLTQSLDPDGCFANGRLRPAAPQS